MNLRPWRLGAARRSEGELRHEHGLRDAALLRGCEQVVVREGIQSGEHSGATVEQQLHTKKIQRSSEHCERGEDMDRTSATGFYMPRKEMEREM